MHLKPIGQEGPPAVRARNQALGLKDACGLLVVRRRLRRWPAVFALEASAARALVDLERCAAELATAEVAQQAGAHLGGHDHGEQPPAAETAHVERSARR